MPVKMFHSRHLLVYTILCIMTIYTVEEVGTSITYGCYPNGTITVDNPDKTHYTYAVAFDFELIGSELADPNIILCDLCFNEDKSLITISKNMVGNCRRGRYIQLTLSSKPLSEEIIVRELETTENYRLRCTEVPEEGVTVIIEQEFDPILALFDLPPDMLEPGVTPDFSGSVRSAMRRCCDHRTHPPIKSANVGDHLLWTLDIYHEFYLLPIQCDVYSGLSTTGQPRMTLYDHGCSLDPSLTHYNTTDTFDSIRMYVMDFFVFHFYNSNYITIQCSLKICGKGTKESCVWNTNCGRRKRSSSKDVARTASPLMTQMTLQVISYSNSGHRIADQYWIVILLCSWQFLLTKN